VIWETKMRKNAKKVGKNSFFLRFSLLYEKKIVLLHSILEHYVKIDAHVLLRDE